MRLPYLLLSVKWHDRAVEGVLGVVPLNARTVQEEVDAVHEEAAIDEALLEEAAIDDALLGEAAVVARPGRSASPASGFPVTPLPSRKEVAPHPEAVVVARPGRRRCPPLCLTFRVWVLAVACCS